MYRMEYHVVQGTVLSDVETTVNALAEKGWAIQQTYGVLDYRGMLHVVWMWRSVKMEGDNASY